jgi:tetratricopeptide (TPR) repeat protein
MALQGLAQARQLGLRNVEAQLLNTLEIAADRQGDLVGALDLSRQILQLHRQAGDRLGEAIILSNLGSGWTQLGDLRQAHIELDAALQMLRANGDRTIESAALGNLSTVALWQGDETRALALARLALEIAVSAQAREWEAIAQIRLGNAETALGRLDAARQAYSHVLAQGVDLRLQHTASAGLARVALAEGNTAAALAALQPMFNHVAVGGTLDNTDHPRQIELTCHQALASAGDPHAADWLARAHHALMAQAAAISDAALCQGFLQHIPFHREIVAA